jgi:hypothetical protein
MIRAEKHISKSLRWWKKKSSPYFVNPNIIEFFIIMGTMQKPPDALFTFRLSLLQMPKKCIHCQYARLVSKTQPCLRRSECDTNKKLRAHNQR